MKKYIPIARHKTTNIILKFPLIIATTYNKIIIHILIIRVIKINMANIVIIFYEEILNYLKKRVFNLKKKIRISINYETFVYA